MLVSIHVDHVGRYHPCDITAAACTAEGGSDERSTLVSHVHLRKMGVRRVGFCASSPPKMLPSRSNTYGNRHLSHLACESRQEVTTAIRRHFRKDSKWPLGRGSWKDKHPTKYGSFMDSDSLRCLYARCRRGREVQTILRSVCTKTGAPWRSSPLLSAAGHNSQLVGLLDRALRSVPWDSSGERKREKEKNIGFPSPGGFRSGCLSVRSTIQSTRTAVRWSLFFFSFFLPSTVVKSTPRLASVRRSSKLTPPMFVMEGLEPEERRSA